MTRPCTVCIHPDRIEIERETIMGLSSHDIASRYGVGRMAVLRHKQLHIPDNLPSPADLNRTAEADDLIDRIQRIQGVSEQILNQAVGQTDGAVLDTKTALKAIKEIRANVELTARLIGELQAQQAQINILVAPEWVTLRLALMAALRPYPEAARAAADALLRLEHHEEQRAIEGVARSA